MMGLLFKSIFLVMTLAILPAGTRVDNLNYELPGGDAEIVVFCLSAGAMESALDHLDQVRIDYNRFGSHPPGCHIFIPPVTVSKTDISHFYITDDGELYGIVEIFVTDGVLYSYIIEGMMSKKDTY